MASYRTLEKIRNLEGFLGFESECNTGCCSKTSLRESEAMFNRHDPEQKEKSSSTIKNYFIGNSPTKYIVSFDKKTKKLSYVYPRNFSKDLNNVKDYFLKLISKIN